jgi:hypothetical protein
MQRKLDQWTTALAVLALVGTLLACKKRTTTTAPAAETAAALPTTPPVVPAAPTTPPAAATDTAAEAAAAPTEPKLGEVKRYPDKEKPETGAVRVLEDDVKVFNEADDKTAEVATLTKNLLVFRLASVPGFELVEFPSGVGKVSPGWVLTKQIDVKTDAKVERGAVATQSTQAVVKTPKASSSAVAKTAASSSAKAAADKAAADKAAADKAAADKAAADKAAADKAALEKAAAKATKFGETLKKAAEAAVGGKSGK